MLKYIHKYICVCIFAVMISVCYGKEMGARNESILRYYTNIYRSNLETLRHEIDNAKTREDALKLIARAKKKSTNSHFCSCSPSAGFC